MAFGGLANSFGATGVVNAPKGSSLVRHLGHFPFCLGSKESLIQQGAGNIALEYPISMDLFEVMAMFYRVRTWRLDFWGGSKVVAARTFTEAGGAPAGDDSIYKFSHFLRGNNEKGLIALSSFSTKALYGDGSEEEINNEDINFPYFPAFYATSTSIAWEGGVTSVDFNMFLQQMFPSQEGFFEGRPNLTFGNPNQTPIIRSEDNKYWPQFTYYGGTPPLILDGEEIEIEFTTVPPQFNPSTVVGTATLEFLGLSFAANLFIQTPQNPETAAQIIAHAQQFASGSVSAIEYFEYDPEDGLGPIYDSQTGEQRRAFPS
jgi:hypothetical protein